MRRFLILPLLCGLAGCVSAEEQVRAEQARIAQLNAAINRACREEGYRPGTDGFRNCRLVAIQMIHQQQQAAAVADAQRRQAMLATGLTLLQSRPAYTPPPPMLGVQCMTRPLGGYIQTNCY